MSALKALLASKVRSNNGCWTCRLRRKKCDETKPICDGCAALEITCYFGDEKPDWMDSGPKQREMSEKIKSQVKKQASQRRDRKYLEMLEVGTSRVSLGEGDKDMESNARHANHGTQQSGLSSGGNTPRARPSEKAERRLPHGISSSLTPPSSNTSGASPPEIPWHSQLFTRQEKSDDDPDGDLHFIMIYLDYVFPYLFPHYRPPLLVGGRGWILDVLQSSRAVYHTAISLASYFFSVVLSNGEDQHQECTNRMVNKLQTQVEKGLRELQKDVSAINGLESRFDIHEGLRVLQSIMQMLMFEVATSSRGNWKLHLDAAIALFIQIIPQPDIWSETLHSLYTFSWPPLEIGFRRPWSTAQASLRFFTASILHMDVMASITLESAPRLYRYQPNVIPGCKTKEHQAGFEQAGPLYMEEFFGIHNSVLQMLADVSSLDSWKKVQLRAGSFSQIEFSSRAEILGNAIKAALHTLESQIKELEIGEMQLGRKRAFPLIVQDALPDVDGMVNHPVQAFHNIIWLQAVLSYFYVVVHGWKPSSPGIRASVARSTGFFMNIDRPTCLRGLVWPLCVSGCLCPPEDEEKYRKFVALLGPLQVFGTMKEASDVMERVWSRREQLDETWDIAKCMKILGHDVLLI